MNQVSDIIKTFFEDFERASNTFESDLLTSQFSDPFMSADPHGDIQIVKKDNFLTGIAKRQGFIPGTAIWAVSTFFALFLCFLARSRKTLSTKDAYESW